MYLDEISGHIHILFPKYRNIFSYMLSFDIKSIRNKEKKSSNNKIIKELIYIKKKILTPVLIYIKKKILTSVLRHKLQGVWYPYQERLAPLASEIQNPRW